MTIITQPPNNGGGNHNIMFINSKHNGNNKNNDDNVTDNGIPSYYYCQRKQPPRTIQQQQPQQPQRRRSSSRGMRTVSALGTIFLLLLISLEVVDRCLFFNNEYFSDRTTSSNINQDGGGSGSNNISSSNNGNSEDVPKDSWGESSFLARNLRSMAALLRNASEDPPKLFSGSSDSGVRGSSSNGSGNEGAISSGNDIGTVGPGYNNNNANKDSVHSFRKIIAREAQSIKKPMSDVNSDDLEEGLEEWPPKKIVDKLVDSLNRVVVIGVNCGFIDMADNYLNSIVKLGVKNFVIVPLDTVAHDVMLKAYPGHVVPVVPELQGVELQSSANYDSDGFRILTSIRPTFLLHFVESGYSPFYNDVDMVWKKNLFETLMDLNQNKALLVFGKGGSFGDGANTSTIFLRPTKENIQFLRVWKTEMETGKYPNDQFGFNAVLNSEEVGLTLPRIFEASDKFPLGKDYFTDEEWNRDAALLVHNNGLKRKEDKIWRFKKFKMWEPSGKLEKYQCKEESEDIAEADASKPKGKEEPKPKLKENTASKKKAKLS